MAKKQFNTRFQPSTTAPAVKPPFDEARDELFQHIMRCGVTGSAIEHQSEWFDNTMAYLTDRYPELDKAQIAQLRTLGERFAQPPKAKQAV